MNSGHLPVSENAARRVGKSKGTRKRGRPRGTASKTNNSGSDLPAVGTLARTKALLLAALKVWELKHRVSE